MLSLSLVKLIDIEPQSTQVMVFTLAGILIEFFERLEPCAVKVACTVLRGAGLSNEVCLLDNEHQALGITKNYHMRIKSCWDPNAAKIAACAFQ